MKRLNYYQVHKNKKPKSKKIKNKYINLFVVKSALSTAMASLQLKKIMSQQFQTKEHKALQIMNCVVNQSLSIVNISKEQKKQRYLNRLKK